MANTTYTNFNGRIVHENRGGVQRDYMRDPLGSTAALLNVAGNESDRWEYWPYGEVAVRSGNNPTPFNFVGTLGYYLDVISMLYVRARYLRTDLTNWISWDPLWPLERPYAYAVSSPTVQTDPTGFVAKSNCSLALYCKQTWTPKCRLVLYGTKGGKPYEIGRIDAGSGGKSKDPIPTGCFMFSRSFWIDKSADSPAWGQGDVCMTLKPCPDQEARMREENPNRKFHPGNFCIHGGADVNKYNSSGCITLTDSDVGRLKKLMTDNCSTYPSGPIHITINPWFPS